MLRRAGNPAKTRAASSLVLPFISLIRFGAMMHMPVFFLSPLVLLGREMREREFTPPSASTHLPLVYSPCAHYQF